MNRQRDLENEYILMRQAILELNTKINAIYEMLSRLVVDTHFPIDREL